MPSLLPYVLDTPRPKKAERALAASERFLPYKCHTTTMMILMVLGNMSISSTAFCATASPLHFFSLSRRGFKHGLFDEECVWGAPRWWSLFLEATYAILTKQTWLQMAVMGRFGTKSSMVFVEPLFMYVGSCVPLFFSPSSVYCTACFNYTNIINRLIKSSYCCTSYRTHYFTVFRTQKTWLIFRSLNHGGKPRATSQFSGQVSNVIRYSSSSVVRQTVVIAASLKITVPCPLFYWVVEMVDLGLTK